MDSILTKEQKTMDRYNTLSAIDKEKVKNRLVWACPLGVLNFVIDDVLSD